MASIFKVLIVFIGVFAVTSGICPLTPTGLLCTALSTVHNITVAVANIAPIAPLGCGVLAPTTHCCSQWCAPYPTDKVGKCDYTSGTSLLSILNCGDNTSPNTGTGVCTCPGDLLANGCIFADGRDGYMQGFAPTLSACQAHCNELPAGNTCRTPAYVSAAVAVCICYCAP